ncbi:hypothetical protein HDV05_006494 [Chytridiales sp. JEL 0842]|nr:hypothetical protein HDV05_006494 [Chytridiales sp. JEL 0842]
MSSLKARTAAAAASTTKTANNNIKATAASASASTIPPAAEPREYEEWMKIAADNKINNTNSWNLGLINYFHDLTVLKDGDSINFQKASYTLDGCIKIFSSRVDSVDLETKKLLSGLADRNGKNDDESDNEQDNETGEEKKKKRSFGSKNTLEKDFSSLNVKKLDMDFMVDPLFKKTSADFDEGTASGLLLNHLSITNQGMIIFDSSDVSLQTGTSEAEAEQPAQEIVRQTIALGKLKDKFMQNIESIWDLDVCPSLKTFEFGESASDFSLGSLDSFIDSQTPLDDSLKQNDDDGYDDADYFDDFVGGNEPDNDGPSSFEDMFMEASTAEDNAIGGKMVTSTTTVYRPDDNIFSYFDASLIRRWAGPEHWKRTGVKVDDKLQEPAAPRKKREKVKVNFFEEPADEAELFAMSSLSTTIPKGQQTNKSKLLLPKDEHFSSKDFFRLFLKPNARAVIQSKDGAFISSLENVDHIDEEFLSETQNAVFNFAPVVEANVDAADDNAGDMSFDGGAGIFDGDDWGEEPSQNIPLPLPTSNSAILEYGEQLVAEPKKIKSTFLHYARAPKKVDVKRLKENLWDNMAPDMKTKDTTHQFTEVIQNLKPRYQEAQLKDISVAFCFICVLHLANEKNLIVEGDSQLSDLRIIQQTA